MTASSGLSYEAIRAYAERIGEAHEIYDSAGCADVHDLVRVLGGHVEISDWRSDESLHVGKDGSFTIYLPPSTSMRRDRFTMAHELGHYFLHHLYPENVGPASFNRGSRNRAETEANVFASSLLMPAQAFKEAHARLYPDIHALARQFDVSPAAASVRCQVLGLAT